MNGKIIDYLIVVILVLILPLVAFFSLSNYIQLDPILYATAILTGYYALCLTTSLKLWQERKDPVSVIISIFSLIILPVLGYYIFSLFVPLTTVIFAGAGFGAFFSVCLEMAFRILRSTKTEYAVKKIKFDKWSLIQFFFQIFFGGIAVLWLFGLTIQLIVSLTTGDYSIFKEYGRVALTVFGFTLIGGIFEKKKRYSVIEKQLFDSSLSFLLTSISFYVLYSLSPTFSMDLKGAQLVFIFGSICIFVVC